MSADLLPATGPRRLLLAGLCLLLGGVLWFEASGSAEETKVAVAVQPPPKATHAPPAGDTPFVMPPLTDFAEVVARPLFSESRRPAAPTPAPTAPSSSFVLVGIVLSSSGHHALIERGQPPKLARVAEGQEIDGWQVEAIRPDGVLIRRDQTREVLKPKDRPPKASADPTAVRKPGG